MTYSVTKDFPKLTECSTSPWKKQTEFIAWINKVMTYANGIHSRIGEYVAQCMKDADSYLMGNGDSRTGTSFRDGLKLIISW